MQQLKHSKVQTSIQTIEKQIKIKKGFPMKHLIILALSVSISCSIAMAEETIIEDNAQKSTYVNGVRQGMTWWYDDKHHVKSKVNFDKGKENGIYTSYYDNGNVKLVVEYVNGQKHNIQKMYYNNGQLGSQVNYNMGRREGVMMEWDSEGFKSSEVFYKHNYKVGVKKYFDHRWKSYFHPRVQNGQKSCHDKTSQRQKKRDTY